MFDAWIRQFVEEIVNVDTSEWNKFHRWDIINAALKDGAMMINHLDSGDELELPSEPHSEAESAEMEVLESEEKTAPLSEEGGLRKDGRYATER